MQIVGVIGYILLGLFQLAAIMAGLEEWLGLHWIFAIMLASFIAYIPLLGTIVGVMGAMEAWHWDLWQSIGLFFGPLILIVTVVGIMAAAEKITQRKDSDLEK